MDIKKGGNSQFFGEITIKASPPINIYIYRSVLYKSLKVEEIVGEGSDIIYTRRYGPLRGPTSSSCGGLRPPAEAFFALRAKRELSILF